MCIAKEIDSEWEPHCDMLAFVSFRKLCQREDKLIEDSVKLHNVTKKKGCCSR